MATSKIADYIDHRTQGVDAHARALAAGYSVAGLAQTVSRLEARDDVKAALRAAKRAATKSKPLRPLTSPTSKRQHRSVDDQPRHGEGPDKNPLDPWRLKDRYSSPLDLMLDVMNNPSAPGGLRIQCAKDAMPYCHARKEGGKKDDEKNKAKNTNATSKFGTGRAPSHLQRVA